MVSWRSSSIPTTRRPPACPARLVSTCWSSSSAVWTTSSIRLGFAMTRRDARQLVSHNHFTVNGKRVNIPSYQVKAGDVIEVASQPPPSSSASCWARRLLLLLLPSWLERDKNALKGTVTKLPVREDIDVPIAGAPHRRVVLQVILLTVFYDFSNRTGAFGHRLNKEGFYDGDRTPQDRDGRPFAGWPLR